MSESAVPTPIILSSLVSTASACICIYNYPKNFLWLGHINHGRISHVAFMVLNLVNAWTPAIFAELIPIGWVPAIVAGQLLIAVVVFPYLRFGVRQGEESGLSIIGWLKGDTVPRKTPAELDDDMLLRFVNHDLVRWLDQTSTDEIWAEIDRRGLGRKVHKRFRRP